MIGIFVGCGVRVIVHLEHINIAGLCETGFAFCLGKGNLATGNNRSKNRTLGIRVEKIVTFGIDFYDKTISR